MSVTRTLDFSHPLAIDALDTMSTAELDELDFGVIGFDDGTVVREYNAAEAQSAGLAPGRVLGSPLFTVVAPCMNNYMVAQRYVEAAASGKALDATIDYVLTLRMRPSKVRLRLLARPGTKLRYLLVSWD
jgi:photoactive yellow protein